MAQLLDSRGSPVDPKVVARIRADATDWADNAGAPGSGVGYPYQGAQRSGQWFDNWQTGIRSPDLEYLPFRDVAVARARDLARNEPVAGAAISRRKNSAIGKGWRLSSKPNARALGITPAQAAELAGQIESEFSLYVNSHNFQVDAERKLTFGQMLRVAVHGFMADGEGCGALEWAANEGTRYSTRLRIIDPDRLSNPSGRMNDAFWRNGIEHVRAGVPIRYWFREAHPADFVWTGEAFQWVGLDRFVNIRRADGTIWQRPQVLHWFDAERAQQSRGVTRFVQTLKSFRALSKFTDATLQNAAINALKVGFVYSSAGAEAVSESLSPRDLNAFNAARTDFYANHPIGDGDEAHYSVLPPGDKIEMATAERQVTGFDAFVRAIIRLIAASLGVTYEEISMDYSQTNYSSARAALIHAQAETESLQGIIEAQLVRPFYVAWLQEAFDKGFVQAPAGAPAFEDAADAYSMAKWIGPKRGYIDPVKEILAAAARIEVGISTLEDECAEQGKDWEEVIHQQGREAALRKSLGLDPEDVAAANAIQDTKNPAKKAPPVADPPGEPSGPAPAPAKGSALARIAALTRAPGYDAELDARPAIAA